MADVVALRGRGERRSLDDSPIGDRNALTTTAVHRLDSEQSRKLHQQLLQWYYYERDRQAQNRLEQAIDHDYYDNRQWDADDADVVSSRNQMPLTYNEVAPMCDWVIGTERRNRFDWKILPRTEDDVQSADVKTKVMKYIADVNKAAFARSRAFADAVKGGIGWVDDGARDDPSKETIYSQYEDWRNVLMDSSGLDLMGDDARYVFRWRRVDEDVAMMMFPDRQRVIHSAVEDLAYHIDPMGDDTEWATNVDGATSGQLFPFAASSASASVDAQRRRVKLIECQFRMPTRVKIVSSGPLKGAFFDQRDRALVGALNQVGGSIIDKITMRVHVAVFTEEALLAMGPSAYRHNKFSLTPIVCYRDGRTRMFYGAIRRVRDIQNDLNKRASKAQFLLNTNQVIGEEGATDDWDELHEQAQDPQGRIIYKPGYKVEIRRDTDAATGQLQLMTMAAQSIQKSAGVTDENLGRKTNAISGEAIKARQNQGAVVTTEIFDNLRLSGQTQGEKQLSLAEQFISEERVIRLTGAKGKIEWLKINQPETQPDGSVRILNDITSSMADFVVSEADYSGTLRQVMFDSLVQLGQKLPPEAGLRLFRVAMEFSDLPNKSEIADELRRMTGEQDPDKELTPEEAQQAQQQMQAQAEAMQVQRETMLATLEEQRAKAQHLQAQAAKVMAEMQALQTGSGGEAERMLAEMRLERATAQVREQAAAEIEALASKLQRAQADSTAATMKINRDADTAVELAHIKAAADERVAEIQAANQGVIDALTARLEKISQAMQDVTGKLSESERAVKALEKARVEDEARKAAEKEDEAEDKTEGKGEAEKPEAAPQPPIVIVAPPAPAPAAPASSSAKASFSYSPDGKLAGVSLKRDDGTEMKVEVQKPTEGGNAGNAK